MNKIINVFGHYINADNILHTKDLIVSPECKHTVVSIISKTETGEVSQDEIAILDKTGEEIWEEIDRQQKS